MEESVQDLHALLVLMRPEQVADLQHLILHLLVFVIEDKPWLNSLNLGFEEAEGIWICDFEARAHFHWQFFVRLAQLVSAMGIRAVFTEMTLLFLLEVLAHLSLVVVVWNIQHLVLNFNWQLLHTN